MVNEIEFENMNGVFEDFGRFILAINGISRHLRSIVGSNKNSLRFAFSRTRNIQDATVDDFAENKEFGVDIETPLTTEKDRSILSFKVITVARGEFCSLVIDDMVVVDIDKGGEDPFVGGEHRDEFLNKLLVISNIGKDFRGVDNIGGCSVRKRRKMEGVSVVVGALRHSVGRHKRQHQRGEAHQCHRDNNPEIEA